MIDPDDGKPTPAVIWNEKTAVLYEMPVCIAGRTWIIEIRVHQDRDEVSVFTRAEKEKR